MTYQESLNFLYEQLPMYQRVGKKAFKKDLTNTRLLLKFLGNPETSFRSIHIAGTNGKGSSAEMLNAIFIQSGYRTGCYTSPHLKSFRERIRVDGHWISEEAVIDFVSMIRRAIDRIEPSFFEITVAMAFWYFAKQEIDMAIVETGLGGRLDSTNVIVPEVALITKIGMDHMDMLGDTLTAIAGEKAGIIKPRVPVVIGSHQEEVYPVFADRAKEMQCAIFNNRRQYKWNELPLPEIGIKRIRLHKNEQTIYPDLIVNSEADYVLDNLPGVLEVLEVLKPKYRQVTNVSVQQGLREMQLKGRMQVLGRSPVIVADISHNEQGLKALFKQVLSWNVRKLRIVLGLVREKDLSSVLKILPKDAAYYLTQSHVPRALPVSELKIAALEMGISAPAFANVNAALNLAKAQADLDDCILICGSTFVVAEIDSL